jgi:nucleoside-diphosphate-sugar epimerase
VVHLAADPRHTPDIWWDTLIPDNVVATANVYEAARRGGARRLVFFSSTTRRRKGWRGFRDP